MILLTSIRVLLLVVLADSFHHRYRRAYTIYEENCNNLTVEPYFEPEMVVGVRWRIYYSWNMKLEDKCMDMVFVNATTAIVSRFFHDMYEYLESQPYWDAATLLVSMGISNHEMLLFADQGAAGKFIGVPNVIRDGNFIPDKKVVPLFKIHMKLLSKGKYLVLSDCNIGVSTLSAKSHQELSRKDVMKHVRKLDLGEGHPACLKDFTVEDSDSAAAPIADAM